MKNKFVMSMFICILLSIISIEHTFANEKEILFVHDGKNEIDVSQIQASLDALNMKVTTLEMTEVNSLHIQQANCMITLSKERMNWPEDLQPAVRQYKGKWFFIGLPPLTFSSIDQITVGEQVMVRQIDEYHLNTPFPIYPLIDIQPENVLIEAKEFHTTLPFVAESNGNYWVPVAELNKTVQIYLSMILSKLVDLPKQSSSFILLGPITPFTSLEQLIEMERTLKAYDTPLLYLVRPYEQQQGKGRYDGLNQNKKLIEHLQKQQQRGARIVVEQQQEESLNESAFRLLIHEKLYPYGLTISDTLATKNKGFSTVFQTSYTNKSILFLSTKGPQTIYPMTMEADWEDSLFLTDKQLIERIAQINSGIVSIIIPPFAPQQRVENLLIWFEQTSQLNWLKWNQIESEVDISDADIQFREDGTITHQIKHPIQFRMKLLLDRGMNEVALWILTLVVGLTVFLFSIYIISMRVRAKKAIFNERSPFNG